MAEKETVDRPDLEEFLSALSGFVDKKSAPPGSSYLKFLDIFCRSVGSTEGHLLRPDRASHLESVAVFGVAPKFETDFNASRNGTSSPLDRAFTEQRVVAIVEIKKQDVPPWFFSLMERNAYRALVAVPIIGPAGATGLLCAYYRDVCLFDQETLDRLSTVGRMLGGAEVSSDSRPEKKDDRRAPVLTEDGDPVIDRFVAGFAEKPFTKIQVFAHLVETVVHAFPGCSVICGPVRMVGGEMIITVADAGGVPSSTVSHRFPLPPGLRQRLVSGEGPGALPAAQQGELKSIIKSPTVFVFCRPIFWQGKVQAAVIAWRAGGVPYREADDRRLGRITAIAALALNAV